MGAYAAESARFSYNNVAARIPKLNSPYPDKVVPMRTPANIAGHPIHPMLVTIPIGLWLFSLVADLVALRSAAPQSWSLVAFYSMIGGIVGALAAAVPGLVDLLSLKDRAIRKTALIHMSMNLTIVALYVVNAWMRANASVTGDVTLGLSVLAIALLVVSGWLGGKMVYLSGVGVSGEDTAPQNAAPPSREGDHRHA
ncbi:MAG: DUF2231 domain-containing protein [Ramlibacter sp.]|nr:DUF2231 domain-containing protein [Ramlibacter sp.]